MVVTGTPASRSRTDNVPKTRSSGMPAEKPNASMRATRKSLSSRQLNLRFSVTATRPRVARSRENNRLDWANTGDRHGQGRQDGRAVEGAAHARAIRCRTQARYRARVLGQVPRDQGARRLRLRLLRAAALLLGDQVRFGHRLAELLAAGRLQRRRREGGLGLVHDAHRGAVLALRRAPRPRLRRRPAADGAALLHEFGGAGFPSEGRASMTFATLARCACVLLTIAAALPPAAQTAAW